MAHVLRPAPALPRDRPPPLSTPCDSLRQNPMNCETALPFKHLVSDEYRTVLHVEDGRHDEARIGLDGPASGPGRPGGGAATRLSSAGRRDRTAIRRSAAQAVLASGGRG